MAVHTEIHGMGEDSAFFTVDEYWECSCLSNFIHPKSADTCPECGDQSEDCPDARLDDMLSMGMLEGETIL